MRRIRNAAGASLPFLLLLAAGVMPKTAETVPVLVPPNGGAPDATSRSPALAPSGRVAALATEARNVLAADPDGVRDILVVRMRKGETLLASVSSEGVKADGDCDEPALAHGGRLIAFSSEATNLVPDDTNGVADIFVHDMRNGSTWRLSVATGGGEADGPSAQPWITPNGRWVAFSSAASNLVPDDTNGVADIFLHDLKTGATTRASVTADEAEVHGRSLLPRLTPNGRWLAFVSEAADLVPGDGNGLRDAFVRDLKTGAVERVSVATDGTPANGHSDTLSISADGRFVAFDSRGSNLDSADSNPNLDVFLRDRKKGTTALISRGAGGLSGNGISTQPAMSANGRRLAFTSSATDIVPGDTNGASDVFQFNVKTGALERASVSSDGVQANLNSDSPVLSRSGRYVVFSTRATNLFAGYSAGGHWSVALRRP